MKKVLLMCVIALTVYSCSTDRDEQITEKPENLKKTDFEKIKTSKNESGQTNKTESDSTNIKEPIFTPTNSIGIGPTDPNPDPDNPTPNPDPNEGGDPKNLPPRK